MTIGLGRLVSQLSKCYAKAELKWRKAVTEQMGPSEYCLPDPNQPVRRDLLLKWVALPASSVAHRLPCYEALFGYSYRTVAYYCIFHISVRAVTNHEYKYLSIKMIFKEAEGHAWFSLGNCVLRDSRIDTHRNGRRFRREQRAACAGTKRAFRHLANGLH
jgi:hypothetical protein